METPYFLDEVDGSLVFNQENKELVFLIPEIWFNNKSKNAIAEINGEYVSCIGLFNWYIIDDNGKKSELKPFRFPTMILMSPYRIEKAKDLILEDELDNESNDDEDADINRDPDEEARLSRDYRLLHFRKGDKVIVQTRVPQIIDNVELFYKLSVITAKLPTTVPYNELWSLFLENMRLNGSSYGLSAQLFGILVGGICRDPKDISKPFRLTNMSNMHNYKPISIKLVPNYTGVFQAITSEEFFESSMSAILMSDKPDSELPNTSLERVLMQ